MSIIGTIQWNGITNTWAILGFPAGSIQITSNPNNDTNLTVTIANYQYQLNAVTNTSPAGLPVTYEGNHAFSIAGSTAIDFVSFAITQPTPPTCDQAQEENNIGLIAANLGIDITGFSNYCDVATAINTQISLNANEIAGLVCPIIPGSANVNMIGSDVGTTTTNTINGLTTLNADLLTIAQASLGVTGLSSSSTLCDIISGISTTLSGCNEGGVPISAAQMITVSVIRLGTGAVDTNTVCTNLNGIYSSLSGCAESGTPTTVAAIINDIGTALGAGTTSGNTICSNLNDIYGVANCNGTSLNTLASTIITNVTGTAPPPTNTLCQNLTSLNNDFNFCGTSAQNNVNTIAQNLGITLILPNTLCGELNQLAINTACTVGGGNLTYQQILLQIAKALGVTAGATTCDTFNNILDDLQLVLKLVPPLHCLMRLLMLVITLVPRLVSITVSVLTSMISLPTLIVTSPH